MLSIAEEKFFLSFRFSLYSDFQPTNNSVRIVIQISNELFEEPEAADASFQTTRRTFGTFIRSSFHSVKKRPVVFHKTPRYYDQQQTLTSHTDKSKPIVEL